MLKKKKKVCIVGHFGFGQNLLNGQTIKTKIITQELSRQLGKENIYCIDTWGWKRGIFKLLQKLVKGMKECENIVILPAYNGIRFFAPISFLLRFILQTKIHYVVIGGWLPKFLQNKAVLKFILCHFNGIYVETNSMKESLQNMGFRNIYIMPNCKKLCILKENDLSYSIQDPMRLCTFSRVMKEKGIEDIIRAVIEINSKTNKCVYTLDVYGPVENNYQPSFEKLIKEVPTYIRYRGSVEYDHSTEVLKNYSALVFPTKFYTEGIPGTIIDAYASGLPVIASRWESFDDIVEDGKDGFGYAFGNYKELVSILFYIYQNPMSIIEMKKNCIKKAYNYTVENNITNFIHILEK